MRTTVQQRLGGFALMAILLVGTLPLAGCPQQSTLSALVTTLGNAAASIASIEGNAALAQKLQTDTAAASQAVLNWKSGTPAQNAIQALTIVQDDLALISQIPGASQYAPLIALAVATTISILQILNPTPAPVAQSKVQVSSAQVAAAPKTSKQFKKEWNAIVAANPALAQAAIK